MQGAIQHTALDMERENEHDFLPPEQLATYLYQNNSYHIQAKLVARDPSKEDNLYYALFYNSLDHQESAYRKEVELRLETGLALSPHTFFKTPQIHLVSDLNQDGILDIVVYSHTMTETCGRCRTYELFLSNKANPHLIEKVTVGHDCNC